MFIVNSYPLAVVFCFITMMCWGSWGNTQKLAARNWRYELFYWDYVIGMLLFSLIVSFTLGSFGSQGRSFIDDLSQASASNIWSVILGGIIFNASNILLSASTSIAGMSVAFPLGVGLSLVLGVIINYIGAPKGDPLVLFLGVALIVIAIVCNGLASGRMQKDKTVSDSGKNRKGIILAVVAGVLMSFFYRFVAKAMDLNNFENPAPGMLTPEGLLPGIFPRQFQDPSYGNARRRDMVSRHGFQLYCVRSGRSGNIIRSRTGCAYGRRDMGCLYMEGVQGR